MSTFSQRHSFEQLDAPITARNEAPDWLRSLAIQLAYDAGLSPSNLREMLCELLLETPDQSNWSEFPNIDREVRGMLERAEWFRVYDFIEFVCERLKPNYPAYGINREKLATLTNKLNDAFRRKGIGWQILNGQVEIRGEESFEKSIRTAIEETKKSGRHVAEEELHGALQDLSKRPNPNTTGAIRHAAAGLECVARSITGDQNATLGEIIKSHPGMIPPPLDKGIEKIWGYASDQARHVREGQKIDTLEAELVVGLAGAVVTYLIKKAVSDE